MGILYFYFHSWEFFTFTSTDKNSLPLLPLMGILYFFSFSLRSISNRRCSSRAFYLFYLYSFTFYIYLHFLLLLFLYTAFFLRFFTFLTSFFFRW
jgi:hypothetical protein